MLQAYSVIEGISDIAPLERWLAKNDFQPINPDDKSTGYTDRFLVVFFSPVRDGDKIVSYVATVKAESSAWDHYPNLWFHLSQVVEAFIVVAR